VGLGNIASATLGVGKSADGLQAIEWFKNGQIDLMLDYCEQDVKVTKEVYEFGKKNGFVYFTPKGALDKKELKVSW
jgi:DEAD/DEAH box helicase domain-containing protein